MTTWTLVIFIALGSDSGQSMVVQNLPTYKECERINAVIYSTAIDSPYSAAWVKATYKSKCIEALK